MAVEVLGDGRKRLTSPMDDADVDALKAGDVVVVQGPVYAARDAAHKRMVEMLDAGEQLPFDPTGAVIYYVGPTPERPGNVVGSAGPTTASRMDSYTERLLELGVKGMIGKGGRGPAVREQLAQHHAVYMAALGGGGALAALKVRAQQVIAFEELGPEAIRRMELDDLPVWVVNDASGGDYYAETPKPWRKNDLLPEELRLP
ncbi:MAG: FumA C-terminus/TtdB family hydratase beta subunit [Actinomycetota bacterium]|nr:FumA C-terminus/TtdB family hydratase beta subunit [Actinomycetota bacterium]